MYTHARGHRMDARFVQSFASEFPRSLILCRLYGPQELLRMRLKSEVSCGIHIHKDHIRTLKLLQSMSRARWIMETLKHPACTLGWIARLCRIWLSPGKATVFPMVVVVVVVFSSLARILGVRMSPQRLSELRRLWPNVP